MGNKIPSLSKKVNLNSQIKRKDVYFDSKASPSKYNKDSIKDIKGNNASYQSYKHIEEQEEIEGIDPETYKNLNLLSGMIKDTKIKTYTSTLEEKQEYLRKTSPDYRREQLGITNKDYGLIKSSQMRLILNGEDVIIEGVKKEEIEAVRKYLSIPKTTRIED